MLQTCAPGLVVVNIDNGVGAAIAAAKIANQVAYAESAGSSIGPSTISVPPSKDPVFADQVAGIVHAVARSLGVVLALFAVALGFVMIQDRLDRRDPKLALAPVQTEMIGFS